MDFLTNAWNWVKKTVSNIFTKVVARPVATVVKAVVVKPAKAAWKAERAHRFRFTKLIASIVVPFVGVRVFNKWNSARLGLRGVGETLASVGEAIQYKDLNNIPLSGAEISYTKASIWSAATAFLLSIFGITCWA